MEFQLQFTGIAKNLGFATPVVNMVFSDYAKQRIIFYYNQRLKAPAISRRLAEEGIKASRVGVHKFLRSCQSSASIARRPGSGRKSKITDEVKKIVEEKMREDDETTAMQLHQLLTTRGYTISKRTILRCRTALGWTFRGSSYCQLIRDANKSKRLNWSLTYKDEATDGFKNVIWTDESSIQLETHQRFCCRKKGERPKNKPRYSYTTIVTHVDLCLVV